MVSMMHGSPLSQNAFIRAAVLCIAETDEPERQSVSALHHEIFSLKLKLNQDLKEALDEVVKLVRRYAVLLARFKNPSFAPVIEELELVKNFLAEMKRLYDSEKRQEDFKATISAISAGSIVTVSDLYHFVAEKKLAGFFFADVPVVASYGNQVAGKGGKSASSSKGRTDGKSKGKGAASSSANSAANTSLQSNSSSKHQPQAIPATTIKTGNLDLCPPEWLATCDGIKNEDKLKRYCTDAAAIKKFLERNHLHVDSYLWKVEYVDFPQCPPDLHGPKSKFFYMFAFKGQLPVAFIECINCLKEPDRTDIITSAACLMTITKSKSKGGNPNLSAAWSSTYESKKKKRDASPKLTPEEKLRKMVDEQVAKTVASLQASGFAPGDASKGPSTTPSVSAAADSSTVSISGPTSLSTQAHATVDRGMFEGEVQKAVHSYLNTTAQMLLGSRFHFMPFAPGSQTGLPAQESSLVSAMGATSMLQSPSGPYFGPPYFHPAFAMGANTHMVPLPNPTAAAATSAATASTVNCQLARRLPRQQQSELGQLGRGWQPLTVAARPAAQWREDRR